MTQFPNDSRINDLVTYMLEREHIRLRKNRGDDRPWTKDEILNTYKFTNFKRKDDRTTQGFIDLLYRDMHPGPVKIMGDIRFRIEKTLLASAIFRYFGTTDMASQLDYTPDNIKWDWNHIYNAYSAVVASRKNGFTGAYNISNRGIAKDKVLVVLDTLQGLWAQRSSIVDAVLVKFSWRDTITAMRTVPGFGGTGFMAKEVVLDMILAGAFFRTSSNIMSDSLYLPSDFNNWTPVGPGARKGVRCLLIPADSKPVKKDIKPVSERNSLAIILEIFKRRKEFFPVLFTHGESKSYGVDDLTLHDIQWALCEFNKYERTRWGIGRPKSRYTPFK